MNVQASVALASCEAEFFAANGLMVERIYLFRLCKFLCSHGCEENNEKVQKRLFLDPSLALALIRRTGMGVENNHNVLQVLSAAIMDTKFRPLNVTTWHTRDAKKPPYYITCGALLALRIVGSIYCLQILLALAMMTIAGLEGLGRLLRLLLLQ